MCETKSEFFEEHEESLRMPIIELRNSLGNLAIQILTTKDDISKMGYDEMLRKLYDIICDLQTAYDRNRTNLEGR